MWTLSPAELEATQDKVAKLNERAEKRGFTGRLAVEAVRVERTTTDPEVGLAVTEVVYETTISGEAPCYNGWRLLAALDWDGHAGLIVRTAPGVESVDRDGLRPGECDHCKTNRDRRNVYLLANEANEQVQVGSSCIKDFLGHNANPVFISTDDMAREVEELLGGGGFERSFTVATVLAAAWAATKLFGYVRASDYGTTTKDRVFAMIDPRSPADRAMARECQPAVDDAAGMAAKIREFILGDDFTGNGEYVLNLKAIAGADEVSPRNIGILASAPQAWAKAQERTLIRQREASELLNEFVGEPKERRLFTVQVRAVRFIEGEFGTTTLYTLRDKEGHVFKWFASREVLGEAPSQEWVEIKATVKGHEEYQGQKSTMLTRCAVQAA